MADRPEQLWLDVERPIQTSPRRAVGRPGTRSAIPVDRQMELEMVSPRTGPEPKPEPRCVVSRPPEIRPAPAPTIIERKAFAAWLLDQANRRGTTGELAKAARLDRLFPKAGSADDVRARFSAAGADGDAFEALDDAERDYEREAA